MKICKTTLQLSLVAVTLTALGAANAAEVQYDFLTNVSIVGTNVPGEVNVNNATLSFVVDWLNIDDSGPTTTANGSIVSIFASIPTNSTDFDRALLNDNTTSTLDPHFSTIGFGTSSFSDMADSFAGSGDLVILNEISATDPFGALPIFDSWFVAGSHTVDFPLHHRSYSFGLLANGVGGTYGFEESIENSFYDPFSGNFGTESVSISYELSQYLGSGAIVPVPAAAPLGLLGMGIVGWLGRRKCKKTI